MYVDLCITQVSLSLELMKKKKRQNSAANQAYSGLIKDAAIMITGADTWPYLLTYYKIKVEVRVYYIQV